MIERRHDRFRWRLADDFAPLFEAVLAAPPQIVKESPAKLVARHEATGRVFYVKRYRHHAFRLRPLKFFFKRSQAADEWRLAAELEQRQVPIVRHVALGEHWSALGLQESVLITEGFEGVPASEVPGLDGRAIVAFVERMAFAGLVHFDLHPANLLVRVRPWEIRLVDLHGTLLRAPTEQARREMDRDLMLATLRISLPLEVSEKVQRTSHEWRRLALWRRSARCLKINRDFSRKRFGARGWQVRTGALTPEIEKVPRSPEAFFQGARILKSGRSSTVAAAHGLVLKRYNFKKPLNLLKDLLRGSRGRRGFRKAYHLELCGIATPRVIATADERRFGLPARSYLLMEEIPGAVDAGQWAGDERAAARALAQLIGRLHRDGFTHRDLKETNVLLDRRGQPHLIDLDGLSFVVTVHTEEAAKNLERLAEGLRARGKLTRRAVMTFMLAYCRLNHVHPRKLFPRTVTSHARRSR